MTYSAALLYYKGFHAIQAQRIAHVLWNSGRKVRPDWRCMITRYAVRCMWLRTAP